jgi:hypothetical protein
MLEVRCIFFYLIVLIRRVRSLIHTNRNARERFPRWYPGEYDRSCVHTRCRNRCLSAIVYQVGTDEGSWL